MPLKLRWPSWWSLVSDGESVGGERGGRRPEPEGVIGSWGGSAACGTFSFLTLNSQKVVRDLFTPGSVAEPLATKARSWSVFSQPVSGGTQPEGSGRIED
jgi:hypothetical protein